MEFRTALGLAILCVIVAFVSAGTIPFKCIKIIEIITSLLMYKKAYLHDLFQLAMKNVLPVTAMTLIVQHVWKDVQVLPVKQV